MGAWGSGAFENDTACDWKYELEEHHDLSVVEEAIDRVLAAGDGSLDADDACCGLAACEVLARLKGHWGVRDSYTESMDTWVEEHPMVPPAALVAGALAAIDRISGPSSELAELWEDDDDWRNAVADLRARVAG
jgi:hypothetical protein